MAYPGGALNTYAQARYAGLFACRTMMAWQGSNRSQRLPTDWPQRKARIWRRDNGLCQWPANIPPGALPRNILPGPICATPGGSVDHKNPGDDHSFANLWVLCHWHHDRKSAAEGVAARPPKPTRRRPADPHPGLTP